MTQLAGSAGGGPTPAHHVPDEVLLDYAAGTAPEAHALLVASHLVSCPVCRGELGRLESVGGLLLEDQPLAPVSPVARERLMQRLDAPFGAAEPAADRAVAEDAGLPRPLAAYVADGIRWRRVMKGFEEARLPLSGGRGTARLLRIAPGRVMPWHTHRGTEMTLVLHGSFEDRGDVFRRGDVAVADEAVEHRPLAGNERPCICLAVADAPLRLTGWFGRLLNPFVRF